MPTKKNNIKVKKTTKKSTKKQKQKLKQENISKIARLIPNKSLFIRKPPGLLD